MHPDTLTTVVAYGAYLIAEELLTSGLLAVVCAGLVLGSYGRQHGMSMRTAETVDGVFNHSGAVPSLFKSIAGGTSALL